MTETRTHTLSWEAPEFKHYEKSVVWYILLFILLVLLVGYQILTSDYFGAITMIILGVLITLVSRKKPKTVTVELTGKGITLGELFIPYKHFKHFWVVDTPDHKTLNLEASTYLKQTVIVELMDQDPDEVRRLVAKHLEESETLEPSFSQRITHMFHF